MLVLAQRVKQNIFIKIHEKCVKKSVIYFVVKQEGDSCGCLGVTRECLFNLCLEGPPVDDETRRRLRKHAAHTHSCRQGCDLKFGSALHTFLFL